MNFLKGIGLLILGFVGGVIFTYVWIQESVEQSLEIQQDIQKIVLETVVSAEEKRLVELELAVIASNELLKSYRNGSDSKVILYSQLNLHKGELDSYREFGVQLDKELHTLFESLEDKVVKLEEDIEFYFGPL